MPQWIMTAAAACALMFITACNTIEGAGKDIEAGGNKIEETAKDSKN